MHAGVLNADEGKSYRVVGDLNTILAPGKDACGAYVLIHTADYDGFRVCDGNEPPGGDATHKDLDGLVSALKREPW